MTDEQLIDKWKLILSYSSSTILPLEEEYFLGCAKELEQCENQCLGIYEKLQEGHKNKKLWPDSVWHSTYLIKISIDENIHYMYDKLDFVDAPHKAMIPAIRRAWGKDYSDDVLKNHTPILNEDGTILFKSINESRRI